MARIRKENPTRILIIKTATEMFFEHGFSKTTVAALSKKAEIWEGIENKRQTVRLSE